MNDLSSETGIDRPGVFTLVIRSKSALYAAWMPLLAFGPVAFSLLHRIGT